MVNKQVSRLVKAEAVVKKMYTLQDMNEMTQQDSEDLLQFADEYENQLLKQLSTLERLSLFLGGYEQHQQVYNPLTRNPNLSKYTKLQEPQVLRIPIRIALMANNMIGYLEKEHREVIKEKYEDYLTMKENNNYIIDAAIFKCALELMVLCRNKIPDMVDGKKIREMQVFYSSIEYESKIILSYKEGTIVIEDEVLEIDFPYMGLFWQQSK